MWRPRGQHNSVQGRYIYNILLLCCKVSLCSFWVEIFLDNRQKAVETRMENMEKHNDLILRQRNELTKLLLSQTSDFQFSTKELLQNPISKWCKSSYLKPNCLFSVSSYHMFTLKKNVNFTILTDFCNWQ